MALLLKTQVGGSIKIITGLANRKAGRVGAGSQERKIGKKREKRGAWETPQELLGRFFYNSLKAKKEVERKMRTGRGLIIGQKQDEEDKGEEEVKQGKR